ncbi:CobW/P47K domain containing protein, putative [Babesia bigemina]|uniref:CobW/P47K domain containing protein, putative n=1 Tax=Babesia bigemina TaxID=5866 RepID=A0A061D7C3_BABBI|nr:CobW/P47K domain containing protein, putative [Babesia bigemina]CDR96443.1 CobW/P47K domain containing protein, putative [Babesia bigemina]|eukprot:XP_012768629.1 CobW/P47K domain containing protein, putative [Babesia bigemina]
MEATEVQGDRKIPVTLVTGFLGSGKTTFIQRLLKERHGMRIAVLQNEFSPEMGIEKPVLSAGGASVFELPNGCLCCSMKDGIVEAVESILQFRCDFDWLVVEAAGNVDPLELASNFWLDPESPLLLDGVLSVTCPAVIQAVLSGANNNAAPSPNNRKIKDGDIEAPKLLEECTAAPIRGTDDAGAPTRPSGDRRFKLLGNETLDDKNMLNLMRKQLSVADVIIINKIDELDCHFGDGHQSGAEASAAQMQNGGSGSISSVFADFTSMLKDMNPTAKVLKTSFCNVDFESVMNLQMFAASRIMTFLSEGHHDHHHPRNGDHSSSNVFIKSQGVYSLDYVNTFVSHLLWESGATVYRCKGIFKARKDCPMVTDADGATSVFQLQGVGMLFEISETEVADLDDNRFLFIGPGIDADKIRNALQLPPDTASENL